MLVLTERSRATLSRQRLRIIGRKVTKNLWITKMIDRKNSKNLTAKSDNKHDYADNGNGKAYV